MTSRLFLPALALALVLTGCDTVGDSTDSLLPEDLEDAAGAIAQAVALDAGGALDDAATLASTFATEAVAKDGDSVPGRPGCESDRTYDDSGTWNVSISCERGNPEGRFYHAFSREATWRFLDADGNPQEGRQGAVTVEHEILSGTGTHITPRSSAALESLTSDLTMTATGDNLVSTSGTASRSGVHTVFGRGDAQREVDYALTLDLEEVTGPPRRDRWAGAVSGSISGVYTATVTVTSPSGETRTREIDRSFTVTFPSDGTTNRRTRILIGGQRYEASPSTGELL